MSHAAEPAPRAPEGQLRQGGRALLLAIYSALRSLKLYPVENATVQKALDDLEAVTRALIACLDRTYRRATSGALDELKREWLEHAVPMGERVEILSEGRRYTGRLIDLDLEEGLVVQLESGGRRLFSAQTSTIQLAG